MYMTKFGNMKTTELINSLNNKIETKDTSVKKNMLSNNIKVDKKN